MSMIEVLLFTYHWHRREDKDGSRTLVLGADGWTLYIRSPAGVQIQGEDGDGPGDFVGNETAAERLGVFLIVAGGARNG